MSGAIKDSGATTGSPPSPFVNGIDRVKRHAPRGISNAHAPLLEHVGANRLGVQAAPAIQLHQPRRFVLGDLGLGHRRGHTADRNRLAVGSVDEETQHRQRRPVLVGGHRVAKLNGL